MKILNFGVSLFLVCQPVFTFASDDAKPIASSGLRSDGELVQAASSSARYKDLTMKRGKPSAPLSNIKQPSQDKNTAFPSQFFVKSYSSVGDADDRPTATSDSKKLKQP
jgi:hypothetical protein